MTEGRRIGIFSPSQRQQPFVVWHRGCWRIWISYNADVTSGTYLELTATGVVDRVTVNNEEVMEIVRI